ncbi:MAG: xylose isomerase [Epulopiscium sp. Nuni2H_MBin003]|nr:MAG: xylose isomerase [Epulopiscium sp. Nuni2H_MBin003]
MKKLCHISTTNKFMNWFKNDWDLVREFLYKNELDAIELGLTMDYPIEKIPKDLVHGVHLSFYPMWIDYYKGDYKKVAELGIDIKKYYHGMSLVESYKKQFERAKCLAAEYMVFHVCHITPMHSFDYNFDYTNKEVIETTVQLVNAVFTGDGPKLLFENLWWPGLTFLDKQQSAMLLEETSYKSTGFVLDVSHLILTNKKIATEKDAYNYIKQVVQNLGMLKDKIEVVHLNKTLPDYYFKQNFEYKLERYVKETDPIRKQAILMDHIKHMDPHVPFDNPYAKEIIQCINPDVCVYETSPTTINEFNYYIKQQHKALANKTKKLTL